MAVAYRFTDEQIARLRGTESTAALARAFRVSTSPVQRWRQQHKQPRSAAPVPEGGPSDMDLLQDEVRRLRAEQSKTGKLAVIEHRILGALTDAIERTPPCAARYVPPPTPKVGRKTRHELLLLASDWHAGEVVDPQQVSGINVFNWDVLKQRVDTLRDGVLSFAELTPSVSRLTIGWLGDMVNGIIHEELVASNEFPVAEQAVLVGELMGQFVIDLAPFVPELFCAGVAGNHARTKPGHASKNVFDSWDWVAYHMARLRTSHLPNVSWELPKAGSHIVEIAGKRLMLFHGDGIRSSMVGFPAGGVARRANAKQAQFAQRGAHIDMLACGHFHDPQIMGIGRVLVNGSLVGINEFGDKNYGDGADPCQLLATFDKDRSRITQTAFVQT